MNLLLFYYYVPETHLEVTKKAIFDAGAGKLCNYSSCSWETKGVGQFLPEAGSNPTIGTINKLERVIEYKVETLCPDNRIEQVISALKKSHPYEEPTFGTIKLM